VNTNTNQLATTAFVVGQAANLTSPMDGVAAIGVSYRLARQDHVHPSDTSRAPTDSPTFTGAVTVPSPVNATDAANKDYVDSTAAGIDNHASVKCATTAAITLSGTQTIDGYAAVATDRVLVKNQASSIDNGVYVVAAGAWARATDWDGVSEVKQGSYVFVANGTTYLKTGWTQQTAGVITVGTTAQVFQQFSAANSYSAGAGLGLVGSTFSLNTPVAAASGGTGQVSYAVGDLLYASTTTTVAKLADIATGNALLSGGVGVAPSYGKVGLTTHVSGTLPVANGGTGAATLAGVAYGNGTGAFTAASAAQIVAGIGATAVTNATNAATVTGAAQAAITSVGTLTSLTSTGAITADGALMMARSGVPAQNITIKDDTASGGQIFGYSTSGNAKPLVYDSTTDAINTAPTSGTCFHQFNVLGASKAQITTTGLNSAAIGATTPSTGEFTTLSASTSISGPGTGLTGTAASLTAGNATNAVNATTATNASELVGGVAGAVPYQSGVGATSFSAAGTSGQVLTSTGTGAPAWVAQSSIAAGSAATATNATQLGGVAAASYARKNAAQTITGKQTFGAAIAEFKAAVAASAIDLSLGNMFTKTITAPTTFTISNTPATGIVSSFVLDLTNGGAFAITWWAGVKWASGSAPTLTAAGRDVLGFFSHDAGTTWTGLVLAKDAK
jgi:hypothetical protein